MINKESSLLSCAACNKLPGLVSLLILIILALSLPYAVEAQEPLEPPSIPSAESGSVIFADRCANCHGPSGRGDGEMAPDLPSPPRDFTDVDFLRAAVPATMFKTITEGRLDAGMPPFGSASRNPIAEQDRWNLIATVFTLGTAVETVEAGHTVYEENCLSCHGEMGAGDGPEASDQETEPTDLTDLRYWSSRSNEMVFASLQDTAISAHSYALDDADLWDVVDYSRAFSYAYFDPQAALEPIETATISGLVTNGSTEEIVDAGTVTLRAFTTDLEEVLTETTAVTGDGRYTFTLLNVAPDLVFMTGIEHDDLSYNSNPARLSRTEPELDMPIVVFEKTTDPEAINVEQVHLVLDFAEDRVIVSEIYVLSNSDTAVFVGETGNVEDGTFELVLPSGAENVNFQRSFGSFSNFLPATELFQTERGWADTIPLRPGEGGMNLLATYDIPYDDGITVSHPLFYDTANATIVMPDVGISLAEGEWTSQGAQQMGDAGAFLTYAHPGLEAGEALSFKLDGRPNRVGVASSSTSLDGDTPSGLIIGASVFLLVAVGAVFTVRSWRMPAPAVEDVETERLLRTVADLDDAFEDGSIDEAHYHEQREKLTGELAQSWQTKRP
jgi:mono/diheme cytochrome c family protein